MGRAIYYYSGTGNSLWTARTLAQELGDTELRSMAQVEGKQIVTEDVVGFVFPVHMWGVPRAVIDCLKKITLKPNTYCFALAVNAGQVSRTLIQLNQLLHGYGVKLGSGFDMVMPSNYIPWGGPCESEEQQKLFRAAQTKIKNICAPAITALETRPVEKGPMWQRIVFTWLYHLSFSKIPAMDKGFWVDDKCNGCTICEKVCPSHNIKMQAQKPQWSHKCDQCLACIQWCPQKSIQSGKKTPGFERYHHPDIKIADIMSGVSK
jgi:ferredoxin